MNRLSRLSSLRCQYLNVVSETEAKQVLFSSNVYQLCNSMEYHQYISFSEANVLNSLKIASHFNGENDMKVHCLSVTLIEFHRGNHKTISLIATLTVTLKVTSSARLCSEFSPYMRLDTFWKTNTLSFLLTVKLSKELVGPLTFLPKNSTRQLLGFLRTFPKRETTKQLIF